MLTKRLLVLGIAIFSATCDSETVSEPPPTPTITITPSAPITLAVGQQATVSAVVTGLPTNAVTYSSSVPGVATVNATTGVVTAISEGTTTIIAQSTEQANLRASVQVTVTAPPRVIEITPAVVQLFVDQSGQLECTVREGGAPVTVAKTWSSNATSIATVSQAGVVLGVAPGTAIITCTAATLNLSTTRTVTVLPRHTITVTPAPVNVQVGATQALTVAVTDAAGNPVTGRTITYQSLNTSIATVSTAGVVAGVAPGATHVRVTVDGPGGGSADIPVNVTASPSACGETGTYTMSVTLTADPSNHGPSINLPGTLTLQVSRLGQTSVLISGPAPFVGGSGSINSLCQMNVTGIGTVAGFPNTLVRLTGTLGNGQAQTWTYEVGTGGNLPGGQSATYTLQRN